MASYDEVNEDVALRYPGWVAAKPLRNRADYDEAKQVLDGLTGCMEDSPDEDMQLVLRALIGTYEAELLVGQE